jgi:prolyl oligopeptidase
VAKAPATKSDPVTEWLHGIEIVDRYRWLEGDNSDPAEMGRVTSEVAAWTDAQNAYTRKVLDHIPGRARIEARLRALMQTGAVGPPEVRGSRYFFAKRLGHQDQAVIYCRDGYRGESRELVDPVKLDPSGLTTVEWSSSSPDGRLLAFGTFRAGDENTTLHLFDVDAGRMLPLEIPDKTQAPDWLPDGSGFVYQNLRDPKDPYSGQVMFHRLGTDRASDVVLFRQFTRDENEKLATTWGPTGSLSRDGRWLVLGYFVDTTSNDLWIADFDAFRRTGQLVKTVVSVGETGQAAGTVIDDTLFIQTTKGAPRGRVVAVSAASPDHARWRDIVPERSDAVIEAVAFGLGVIAVTYLENASNVVHVFDLTGRLLGVLNQPGLGAVSVTAEEDRTEAYLTFTSFNYPTTIFRVDLARPHDPPELWERPDVPVDPATVGVEQVWYASKDGTLVSMFLVGKRGLERTGERPTILTGYGGFNVSETPMFVPHLFQWFEAGGLYAVPNIRGGGEYGDAWHKAALLERKQNSFDDFIAAADWLVAERYTTPAKLAILGGSNGGLLMGAAITQRPALCRAALVLVPLLDMIRYQHFLMARYWVPEYGSSEDPAHLPFLAAYSPYHHVTPGTAYPAVLFTAGEHDTRVHAMHARKMGALLQACTASDPSTQPVLVWVDRNAGHGQGKPLKLRILEVLDQRVFVMWQLGMMETVIRII